jgi:D-alanyl-D-alanine carboxypeptidase
MEGFMSYIPYRESEKLNAGQGEAGNLQIILDRAVDEFRMPGVQAGVLFHGREAIIASSGTEDFKGNKSLIKNDSIFRIGSSTKMFVAALIGRMTEKGILSFDDTADKWLPWLLCGDSITIRELLSHTSGISENLFSNPWTLIQSALNPGLRWNPSKFVPDIMKGMKIKPRGERSFTYANNNYLILGLIAEKAGLKPLYAMLQDDIFACLHMTNTYLLPFYDKVPAGLVSGWDEYMPFGPNEIKPDTTSWDSLAFSAGGMCSTAGDLLTWLDALFHDRILKPAKFSEMRTFIDTANNGRDNRIINYGLGIAVYNADGNELEGHPGAGLGGECFPFYCRDRDVSIAVLYNLSKKDNPAGMEILKRIMNGIINRESTQIDP